MQVVIVNTPGPQGSSGLPGPSGSQGPSGSSAPFTDLGNGVWNTTSSIEITGSLTISGSSTFTNIGPTILSGSLIVLSGITGSISGSVPSASYALTASYALNGGGGTPIDTGSFATTGSNNFIGDQIITGSIHQSGTFYPDIIDWISSSIQMSTGSYVLTTDNNGVTYYDSYANIANALSPYISINTSSFATTGSNTFKGSQTIHGNLFMSGSFPLVYNNSTTNNMLFGLFDGSTIHGPYLQIFGNQYSNVSQRGGAEIIYDIRNGGDANFHVSSFNGSSWTQKFRVDDNGVQVTGSLKGSGSVAYGRNVFANGDFSHAEGENTQTNGYGSHTEGRGTLTIGPWTHAEGYNAIATNTSSHAEGFNTISSGFGSHAEGSSTQAIGQSSHAEGINTQAIGIYSHAEGNNTQAIGIGSHAEGDTTQAIGDYSHAEGYQTQASSSYSHAEGINTQAIGFGSHAEGDTTQAIGYASHAEGTNIIIYPTPIIDTTVLTHIYFSFNDYVVNSSDGTNIVVPGDASGDETWPYTLNSLGLENGPDLVTVNFNYYVGTITIDNATYDNGLDQTTFSISGLQSTYQNVDLGTLIASGSYSHAEGFDNISLGLASHAEGRQTQAIGNFSHAEGYQTQAIGNFSHAEGEQSIASGSNSRAEGIGTQAIGDSSHAEGSSTLAIGGISHAEGTGTQAIGIGSHAEGINTKAIGDYSHAGGFSTIASGSYQTVIGTFNAQGNTTDLFIIGNGTYEGDRKDIFTVSTSSATINGILTLTPQHPLPSGVPIGSFAVSSSTPPRPYMWDGSSWYAL